LVILAKSEKEMMRNLGKYVRKKKLEMNVEKMKMMVFNKRKKKSEENEWKWEGRKIERSNTSTKESHIRKIVRKANTVGCVWGIGERKWGGDFRRRMMMFESTVENILMYEAEF
jgi:hypothetical protein